ncbi:MAG: CobW family GTP-binding protein [Rikenellaceae bacterium]
MATKSAIVLVTGFLGCGKTVLIKELLSGSFAGKRIAVVQNEFAQTSIDSDILREVGRDFALTELNTGSIFCVCLFSKFKESVKELVDTYKPDIIVVEASGVADPIAIAELVEDEEVAKRAYLSRILTVVDAPRFERALSNLVGVRHQVQVADVVLVNKCDLSNDDELERVSDKIKQINPLACEIRGEFGRFDFERLLEDGDDSRDMASRPRGALTKCGEIDFISKSFRYAGNVDRAKLDEFLGTLTDETLRLKGYVTTCDGESLMIHYVPGQCVVSKCNSPLAGRCEFISIGYVVPQFNLLK